MLVRNIIKSKVILCKQKINTYRYYAQNVRLNLRGISSEI